MQGMFTMQTTSELQTLNSQNARVSFLLTLNKFFTKCKNVAAKTLCGGAVALKIPRKLTCGSSFCNVVGCKTQILMKLGYTRGIYVKFLRRAILQMPAF